MDLWMILFPFFFKFSAFIINTFHVHNCINAINVLTFTTEKKAKVGPGINIAVTNSTGCL